MILDKYSGRMALVRQAELAECGLACVAMVASYHGLDTDLASLRRAHAPSQRGLTLRSLMGIADSVGCPRAR